MDPREAQPHHYDSHWQRDYTERIQPRRPHHSAASPVIHALKSAIMLAPLIASEFVKDQSRAYKWSRIAMGAALFVDQLGYAIQCHNDKERDRRHEESWVERSRTQDNAERSWSR